jgi:hypothetical protein
MKLHKLMAAAAMIACTYFAGASSSDYQITNVECIQINADHIRLVCKMSNKTELSASLINYDVKDSEGHVISSGNGTTVFVDSKKLASEEEYTIIIYAIVNGNAVSQIVTRKAPFKVGPPKEAPDKEDTPDK